MYGNPDGSVKVKVEKKYEYLEPEQKVQQIVGHRKKSMVNICNLNKKLNVRKKVQPILGSGTKSGKKSHLPSDDSRQTHIAKPIIDEVSHLGQ